MLEFNSLIERIKSVSAPNFDALALDVFSFQYQYNAVYQEWCNSLAKTPSDVKELWQIPFLPIEFFKSHTIKTGLWEPRVIFESSGTTGSQTSRHFVADEEFYLENCVDAFEAVYGSVQQYTILALLPSYLERNNSGLVSMVNHFIHMTDSPDSGFYLNEFEDLKEKLLRLKSSERKVILWGVAFGLLDFADQFQVDFADLIIMETGGMKGRREEIVRSEVHEKLKESFGVNSIHSEYGMTELFSQGYSHGHGIFNTSKTMKVIGRDINDPLAYPSSNKTVALNIIDLANIYSCSFIETKDLGTVNETGEFEVKGRMDNSDIRGCNLLLG